MRTLKLLVIGLGILIVGATVALVTVIVHRAGQLSANAPQAINQPIAVPEGFRIAATELSGDRLLVRLEGREAGASGDEVRLLILDIDHNNSPRTVRLMLPAESSP